jgi:hypothetical protein
MAAQPHSFPGLVSTIKLKNSLLKIPQIGFLKSLVKQGYAGVALTFYFYITTYKITMGSFCKDIMPTSVYPLLARTWGLINYYRISVCQLCVDCPWGKMASQPPETIRALGKRHSLIRDDIGADSLPRLNIKLRKPATELKRDQAFLP